MYFNNTSQNDVDLLEITYTSQLYQHVHHEANNLFNLINFIWNTMPVFQ